VWVRLRVPDDSTAPNSTPKDSFALLGLARSFSLTPSQVERAFLSKVRLVHPDTAGAQADISELEVQSARLTSAKRIVLDDELRAGELLMLLGGPSASQDKALPQGFLAEIMSLREEVEADLAADAPAARLKWRQWASAQSLEYSERVGELLALAQAPDDPNSQKGSRTEILLSVRRKLNAWRYIKRLMEQLDEHYDPSRADLQGT
jgi:hypothetical protein